MKRIDLTMDYGALKRGLSRLLKKAKKDGAIRFYIPIELAENICIALEHLGMLKNDSNEGMLWRGK